MANKPYSPLHVYAIPVKSSSLYWQNNGSLIDPEDGDKLPVLFRVTDANPSGGDNYYFKVSAVAGGETCGPNVLESESGAVTVWRVLDIIHYAMAAPDTDHDPLLPPQQGIWYSKALEYRGYHVSAISDDGTYYFIPKLGHPALNWVSVNSTGSLVRVIGVKIQAYEWTAQDESKSAFEATNQ